MTRLLVVSSQKGGVGKTTLALNLSFAMAKRGWRVLLVDSDPQGGIAFSLSKISSSATGLAGFLASGSLNGTVLKTKLATLKLMLVGEVPVSQTHAFGETLYREHSLRKLAEECSDYFDLIILDTAPGFGLGTMAALQDGDFLISPLQAEPGAARTVHQLLDAVGEVRQNKSKIELLGFVINMAQIRNKDSFSVIEDAWAELPPDLVFETVIPRHPIFLRASAIGIPLGLVKGGQSSQILLFDQLAIELEPRIQLKNEVEDESESLFS